MRQTEVMRRRASESDYDGLGSFILFLSFRSVES